MAETRIDLRQGAWVNLRVLVTFGVIMVLVGFACGWLANDARSLCVPENGGRMCIEQNPEGRNERIFYP